MKYIENTTNWKKNELAEDVDDGWIKIRKEFDDLYSLLNKVFDKIL